MLEGALLRAITDFLDPAGIFGAGSTLLAWRALSRQDRNIVNGVVADAAAGQVVLTTGLETWSLSGYHSCKKLALICSLGARVEEIVVKNTEKATRLEVVSLRERLETITHLRSVTIVGRKDLTNAAVQDYCHYPKLQSIEFKRCLLLTDAAIQEFGFCPQLLSVELQTTSDCHDHRSLRHHCSYHWHYPPGA